MSKATAPRTSKVRIYLSEFALSTAPRSPITPTIPPLSQGKKAQAKSANAFYEQPSVKIIGAGLGILLLLVVFILWLGSLFEPQVQDTTPPRQVTTTSSGETLPVASVDAPFSTMSLAQAKEAAQSELGRFVALQIRLEDEFNVQAWGERGIVTAKDQALIGDNHFIQDDFEQAIDAYKAAADQLAKLLREAEQGFAKHLESAMQHVLSLDEVAAGVDLAAAKIIKPQDPELLALSLRAAQLPQIKDLLLQARNLELTEKYAAALDVYAKIKQLDGQTPGLEQNITAAKNAEEKQTIRKLLGLGFKYLAQKDYDKARDTFNKTLQTDATNAIALAGLEQVSQRNDVAIILNNERIAKEHLANEQWSQAVNAYDAILTLDGNIQLAKNGKQLAQAHARAEKVLTRISTQPSKLSDAILFGQANGLLKEAQTLKYKGPRLNALIDSVSQILTLYRDPVLVTLVSDNFTEIVLSNIGKLGVFQSKVLSLRPGEYTIRGSASGCRDIFLTVTVLPGIEPIEVLCRETIR